MELKTDRLYIRSLREDDCKEMKSIFIDFNHSPYAKYERPLPVRDDKVGLFVKKFACSNLFFVVSLLGSKKLIGYVCFHKNEEEYDLGYCFHSSSHLQGYAFESIEALIKYFAMEGGTIFTAGTAIDNIPSCKLLEKLGFVCQSLKRCRLMETFHFKAEILY